MKTKLFLLLVFVFIITTKSNAQKDLEVTVFASSIQKSPTHDCGEIAKDAREVLIYTIKNERKTDIEIKNIKVPSGYMASATESTIKAGKDVNVYVVIETRMITTKGAFDEKIYIETNLIENIEFEITGVYK